MKYPNTFSGETNEDGCAHEGTKGHRVVWASEPVSQNTFNVVFPLGVTLAIPSNRHDRAADYLKMS